MSVGGVTQFKSWHCVTRGTDQLQPRPAGSFHNGRHAADSPPIRSPAWWVLLCDLKVSGFWHVKLKGCLWPACLVMIVVDQSLPGSSSGINSCLCVQKKTPALKIYCDECHVGIDVPLLTNDVCFCFRDCYSLHLQQRHIVATFWLPGFGWLSIWFIQKSRGILQRCLWR